MIEEEQVRQCAQLLARKASLQQVRLSLRYLPTLFTTEYFPSIVAELKTLSGVVNGFFEGAEAVLSGQELTIILRNGGREILCQAGVDRLIQQIIRDHFSISLSVIFAESQDTASVQAVEPAPMLVREPATQVHTSPVVPSSFRRSGGNNGGNFRRSGAVKDTPEEISVDFTEAAF